MARKPKSKPQAEPVSNNFDEFTPLESESGDDETAHVDPDATPLLARSRDWRDVEKFKEMRELRRLVGDDLDELGADIGGPRRNR